MTGLDRDKDCSHCDSGNRRYLVYVEKCYSIKPLGIIYIYHSKPVYKGYK